MDGENSLLFLDPALLVIDRLDCLSIAYMVVGSLAVSAHGVSRGTRDADIVADLRVGDGRRLAAILGKEFYMDAEVAEEAIRRRSSFSVIYMPKVFKVDLFTLSPRAYDREALRRRRWVSLEPDPPRAVFVESPEDVVLSKLRWYRQGGEVSDQQWRDVLGVLKLQAGRLDMEYLRRWAAEEEVLDLLGRALQQAS